MTLYAKLSTIGSFTVGASAIYPVRSFAETSKVIADDAATGAPVRRVTWRIDSIGMAASRQTVGDLIDEIRNDLCRNGSAVTVTEFGGTPRVLGPGGATTAGATTAGGPKIDVDVKPGPETVGEWQMFSATIVGDVPEPQGLVDGFNLVEHSYSTNTSTNENGSITTAQRGTVRVRNDQDAKAYIDSQILAPASAAAAGRKFVSRVEQPGQDAAKATYEYTDSERGSQSYGGPEDVIEARIDVRVAQLVEGSITTTTSGFAVGPDASLFAANRQPVPAANEVLKSSEVSSPSVPEGRVDYKYTVVTGVTDARFPGIVIYKLNETVRITSGARSVVVATYDLTTPTLYLGAQEPFVYEQNTSIEFTGPWDEQLVWTITPLMDENHLASGQLRQRSASAPGLRSLSASMTFIYATDQADPEPRELVVA